MKRKNTTTACQSCRKRRAKCDGRKPRCSRCHGRMLQCTYSIEADGRRPASKSHVELLRSRIDLLERALRAHSIDIEGLAESPDPRSDSDSRPPGFSGSLSRDASMTFDQDGEARYFGMASGRLEFKPTMRTTIEERHTESSASRLRMNSFYQEIINEQVICEELENELIDIYFQWEQPWNQAVDEKLFRDGRATKGKYFSPLLLNCILAIASRLSLRPEVLTDPNDPNTAGRLFLEKAEIILHYELKNPNITTLQALCIMGDIYVAIGADAACWLHIGMASRLALDMGLNIDSASVAPSGWLAPEEVELRKRIYWSLYYTDKLASMYTGRVCTMLDSQAQVCLPKVLLPSEIEEPHDFRRSTLGKVQKATIGICQILERILLAFYTPKSSIHKHQTDFFISSTILELKNWYYDLPKELSLEHNGTPQSEPAVYTAHMVFHTAFIILMKPALLKSQDAESRRVSYQAASDVCNVAQKYRMVFGSFRQSPVTATHCTLSAVLTLINAAHHSWDGISAAVNNKHVELGLMVLEELSVSWNMAKRIRQNLQKLYQPLRRATGHTTDNYQTFALASADTETRNLPDEALVPPLADAVSPNIHSGWQLPASNPHGQSLDAFTDWPFNDLLMNESNLPEAEFFDALHNFSYMETNPIFQFDALPDDYSSFDILNRIHVHNL
ncbi:fungal-specific transcription factor domain-containing protein [Aspergillus pseudoustus]|uniref:Fungal-specific transcription factor domain-containing protein n=1 Tax=Aspergillus pseudoustus TaxID=1810923 RepID=A0ABR4JSU3_9EURO